MQSKESPKKQTWNNEVAADRRLAWDKENTVRFSIKLNKRTDADLLDFLEGSGEPRQTIIKRALRALLEETKK